MLLIVREEARIVNPMKYELNKSVWFDKINVNAELSAFGGIRGGQGL